MFLLTVYYILSESVQNGFCLSYKSPIFSYPAFSVQAAVKKYHLGLHLKFCLPDQRLYPLSPRFSGLGGGGKRRARADGGQQCPQMVPADVESPELCLGLQTLLSLQVR